MAYLDKAGLAKLWEKAKEKFAPKTHSHSTTEISGLENMPSVITSDNGRRYKIGCDNNGFYYEEV